MGLAVDSYRDLRALGDSEELLNLAWTLDERELLDVDMRALVAHELEREAREGLPYANRYLVDDPHGAAILAPAVSAQLGFDVDPSALTAGAGVASLLHALAPLAAGGVAYVAGDVYPDLPHWLARAGVRCTGGVPEADAEQHVAAARAARAAVVLLERPSLVGDRFAELDELRALCSGVERSALVLVDESNANYWPPASSAAALTAELPNLVVLRGLSKAYGLGGLRLGWCVASPTVRTRVRACVPPLLAASLSLRIGAAVLARGDVGATLRARIRTSKQTLRALLSAAGFDERASVSAPLPYVLLDPQDAPRLERLGVLGKRHLHWSGARGRVDDLHRLSAPLAPARIARARALLSPAADADAAPRDRRSAPASPAPARAGSAGCTSPSDRSARASRS